MIRSIVCSRPDGGVSVLHPTEYAYARTKGGGLNLPYPRQMCIDNMVKNGKRPGFAKRWVDTAISGGMTDAEFYEAIIEKDMPKNYSAPELVSCLPDRWFRNAWKRSHNGGPIYIDLARAKTVQAQRIDRFLEGKMLNKAESLLAELDDSWADIVPLIQQIKRARSLEELRTIWPKGH